MDTKALSLSCSLLGAVGQDRGSQQRLNLNSVGFSGAKTDVLQLGCGLGLGSEQGSAAQPGSEVVGAEPHEGPGGCESQGWAVMLCGREPVTRRVNRMRPLPEGKGVWLLPFLDAGIVGAAAGSSTSLSRGKGKVFDLVFLPCV